MFSARNFLFARKLRRAGVCSQDSGAGFRSETRVVDSLHFFSGNSGRGQEINLFLHKCRPFGLWNGAVFAIDEKDFAHHERRGEPGREMAMIATRCRQFVEQQEEAQLLVVVSPWT